MWRLGVILSTKTAAQCGTRIWRTETQNMENLGCESWVSSHTLTKRKLRPETRLASRLIKCPGDYRNFFVPPRKMNGKISQARCHSKMLAPPFYMWGCKRAYQDRVLQPRDWANFAKVMAPKKWQLQGYLSLIIKRTTPGPYRRPMPRVLGRS